MSRYLNCWATNIDSRKDMLQIITYLKLGTQNRQEIEKLQKLNIL